MIFRLTLKLKQQIKASTLETLSLHENPILDWSCHLFQVGRTKYILISNTKTLLSTVIEAKGVTKPKIFQERVKDAIIDLMHVEDHPEVAALIAEVDLEESQFAKALNRSVTGGLNELVRYAQDLLDDFGIPTTALLQRLNDFLLSTPAQGTDEGYMKPSEAFQRLLDEIG